MAEHDAEPTTCITCGKTPAGDRADGYECAACKKRRNDEFDAYWEGVKKYALDKHITRNTKFALVTSSGPWLSIGELVTPLPDKLSTPVKNPMGYHQIHAELGRFKQLMGTAFHASRVYLARTGEQLKYPLDDILMYLAPFAV